MSFPLPVPPDRTGGVCHQACHYMGAAFAFACMVIPLVVSEGSRAWPAYITGTAFVVAFLMNEAQKLSAESSSSFYLRSTSSSSLSSSSSLHGADSLLPNLADLAAIGEWAMVISFYLCLIQAACF